MTNSNQIKPPAGLLKILNIIQDIDAPAQERILNSASIFAYGRASGRKADYAEGFAAGYAKAMSEKNPNIHTA